MYTILLAFVVVAVWEDFSEAANNCDREAAQLFNIWRDTKPLDTTSNAHMRQNGTEMQFKRPVSWVMKSIVFMIIITLNIILIYSLDHPFKGFSKLSPRPYERFINYLKHHRMVHTQDGIYIDYSSKDVK